MARRCETSRAYSSTGLFFDPWGTRIELVEDGDYLGFHHVHLSSNDPAGTLAWYQKNVWGQKPPNCEEKLDGILLGDVWLLAARHTEGDPAPTRSRALDHIGFEMAGLAKAASKMRKQGVSFQTDPAVPDNARSDAKRAFIAGPDSVSHRHRRAGIRRDQASRGIDAGK